MNTHRLYREGESMKRTTEPDICMASRIPTHLLSLGTFLTAAILWWSPCANAEADLSSWLQFETLADRVMQYAIQIDNPEDGYPNPDYHCTTVESIMTKYSGPELQVSDFYYLTKQNGLWDSDVPWSVVEASAPGSVCWMFGRLVGDGGDLRLKGYNLTDQDIEINSYWLGYGYDDEATGSSGWEDSSEVDALTLGYDPNKEVALYSDSTTIPALQNGGDFPTIHVVDPEWDIVGYSGGWWQEENTTIASMNTSNGFMDGQSQVLLTYACANGASGLVELESDLRETLINSMAWSGSDWDDGKPRIDATVVFPDGTCDGTAEPIFEQDYDMGSEQGFCAYCDYDFRVKQMHKSSIAGDYAKEGSIVRANIKPHYNADVKTVTYIVEAGYTSKYHYIYKLGEKINQTMSSEGIVAGEMDAEMNPTLLYSQYRNYIYSKYWGASADFEYIEPLDVAQIKGYDTGVGARIGVEVINTVTGEAYSYSYRVEDESMTPKYMWTKGLADAINADSSSPVMAGEYQSDGSLVTLYSGYRNRIYVRDSSGSASDWTVYWIKG